MFLKKRQKNVKIPKLGGRGPPLGNFPHIIPFFSDHVPKMIFLEKYKTQFLKFILWHNMFRPSDPDHFNKNKILTEFQAPKKLKVN